MQEPDLAWEELEDDFVNLVNEGKDIITFKETRTDKTKT